MKKLYKNLLIMTLITLVTISFNACGGGGGDDAGFSNATTENRINIDVTCITPVTTVAINSYVTMLSGDVLVQATNNTTVETYHDTNGTKKICLVSGSAYLVR